MYTVTLEVFTSTGSDSRTKYNYIDVKMANQPPVSGFSISPDNPITSDVIAFTDSSSDPDGSVAGYAWTFGDGITSTAQNPTHQYSTAGDYQVALTVTDDDGATDTVTHLVIVNAPGTDTYTLDVPGMTVSGTQLVIDTNVAGSVVSTAGNTVTIDYNGLVITIGTSGITTENGSISGVITSINAQSDTITADLPTLGAVHASFNATMNTLPAGAEIESVLTSTITLGVKDAFELVATKNGEEITGIAYIMEIAKTNLIDRTDIGAATVRMSASADWVTANGGPEKIRIIRYTAESGSEFLQPTWTIDDTGQYVFEVTSPNGLSVFGLVASIMDDVPPKTLLESTGTVGNNGWFVSDVTISLTGTDNEGGSGVGTTGYSFDGTSWNTYSSPFTIIAEGTVTVFYNSTDTAGNIEETKQMTFSIDKTPPIISGAATTTPNTDGWYKSDVTVHFTATDLTSAVASLTPDVVLVTEGAGFTATGTATDNAGNRATTTISGINLDTTPPQVAIAVPVNGAKYILSEVVLADWTVNDPLSGIVTHSGTVPSGSAIDTAIVGTQTFSVTATDKAGNEATKTSSYTVAIPVKVKILPQTINIGNKGIFIAFVQLPNEYTFSEVDPKFIQCGGAPAERMIKSKLFPRIFGVIFNRSKLQNIPVGDQVTLTVTGKISHASQVFDFVGYDSVRIINKNSKIGEEIENILKLSDDRIFESQYKTVQFFNYK
jgi:PKD repeat protein